MFLPSIVLALAVQLTPGDQPVAPPPTPITITPDNVDLDGAGRFDFTPDGGTLDVHAPDGYLSFAVRLWVDAAGKPVACDAGQSTATEAMRNACAQLVRSAALHIFPGMAAPLRRGFVDVEFHFQEDKTQPGGHKVFAFDVPGYRNVTIAYPRDQIPPDEQVKLRDGTLAISVTADSYPPIAMRDELESVSTVQLGISRDGAIKNCRPISNTAARTAFLDNYTCALFLRRGRFEFSAAAPPYDGLRYMNRTMRWMLPRH